jgi:hypothetical protein
MAVLKGTISGSIKSTAYNIPCTIKSIGLFNRSAGAIVVNLGVTVSGVDYYFKSSNLAAVGSTGASETILTEIKVAANWQILVVASGSCDYYITIDK